MPALGAEKLDAFLALRRDLRRLETKGNELRRRGPADGERARLRDVPAIMEGVGGLLGERFAAFRKHDIVPAEYDYLEHLVYVTWLGASPPRATTAARERAAHEIDRPRRAKGRGARPPAAGRGRAAGACQPAARRNPGGRPPAAPQPRHGDRGPAHRPCGRARATHAPGAGDPRADNFALIPPADYGRS